MTAFSIIEHVQIFIKNNFFPKTNYKKNSISFQVSEA